MKWGEMNVFPHFYINFPPSHPFKPQEIQDFPLHPCHRDLTDCVSVKIRLHECCHRHATRATEK